MNFMKNSLFQRNLEQEREEEMPEEGGVLAVWAALPPARRWCL